MTGVHVHDLTTLEGAVAGHVVLPGAPDYDELRRGFNAMIDRGPAAIVRVASDADVATSIAFAREHSLPLAIRAGGHSAPGFGCCDDGIVIDVRDLATADVDARTREVRCGSGLTWKQFDAAVQEHGLAVTGGRVSSTGVTGLTIGSGSGWLERSIGLTSDLLIGARMVTADGEVVQAADDPDLLWALRGGGGTSASSPSSGSPCVRWVPSSTAACGCSISPGRTSCCARTATSWRAPPELCGGMALLTAPPAPFVPAALRGRPVVAMIVLWAGDPAQAEAGVAALDALGPADVDRVGPMPYTELQQIMDAGAPAGHRDYFKGGFISEVSNAAIDAIVGLGADLRAPLTQIIWAPLGAGTAYAAADETHSAIGHRDETWSFQVLSLWEELAEDAEKKAWTKAAADTMSSHSEMVSYANFLSADEAVDVERAYTPATLDRLRAVKDRYDPHNVFSINHNIRPTTEAAR